MEYVIVKWVHVLSSAILFGTGIGSAYYMLTATMGRDPVVVAAVSRNVVIADWMFTSPTAVLQPLTGFWLVHLAGMQWSAYWLKWSIVLYIVAIACWLPVVHLQIRMRDVAVEAMRNDYPLPPQYWKLFWTWFALGIPAFLSFVGIFYLMVTKLQ